MNDVKLGYSCPVEMCETRCLLEEVLFRLVYHDLAADAREDVPSCRELQDAVNILKDHCGYTNMAFKYKW